MKIYCDLHIHTGLSPCGDNDMSPNNIVNMALLNGLDVIAVTDHNAVGNVLPVMEAAKETGLLVIPGMELCTSEEVHMVCLFADLESASAFGRLVSARLLPIQNKPDIFGRQLLFDAGDNVIGEVEALLISAAKMDVYEAAELVGRLGGVIYPAHIDRPSNSIMSNLGFIPPDLNVHLTEYRKNADPAAFLAKRQKLFKRRYGIIKSSDAHALGDIAEREQYFEMPEKPDASAFIEFLKQYGS